MSKKCAKCEKTVYPAEELKCLDKVWHKVCFKCWECGMALTMKNYKGYNKLPYCSAHYPQTKATVVVDTPEQRRLAQTSMMQSQAVYHADFEKNIKGTLTSLADDPETKRVKEITSVVSQAAYANRQTSSEGNECYVGGEAEVRETRTPYVPPQNPHMPSGRMLPIQQLPSSPQPQEPPRFDPSVAQRQPLSPQMQHQPPQYQSAQQPTYQGQHPQQPPMQQPQQSYQQQQYSQPQQSYQQQQYSQPQQLYQTQQKAVQQQQQNYQQQTRVAQQLPPQQHPLQQQPKQPSTGPTYVAMYDYDAQDSDEVSFLENDRVVQCEIIDEGWMVGTIQRTGFRGMVPANYVQKI